MDKLELLRRAYYYTLELYEREEKYEDEARCKRLNGELDELREMIKEEEEQ